MESNWLAVAGCILAAFLLIKALVILFTYALFLLHQRQSGEQVDLLQFSKVTLLEIFSFWILPPLLLRPLFSPIKNLFPSKRGGVPILLIHGYCMNSGMWIPFEYNIRKKNLGPIYTLNLFPPFTGIENLAAQVKKKIASIRSDGNNNKVILIGHSQGGLVAAYYAEHLAPEGEVSKVITIASPLKGTRMGKLGIGKNSRQMSLNSAFTSALASKIRCNERILYYHISMKMDNLILPSSSALLNTHPSREATFDHVGHLSSAFSPKVAQKVAEWIILDAVQDGHLRPY
jgi:triacylglycerol esterase/lipase EstA (alpha/beta hydrolase family)